MSRLTQIIDDWNNGLLARGEVCTQIIRALGFEEIIDKKDLEKKIADLQSDSLYGDIRKKIWEYVGTAPTTEEGWSGWFFFSSSGFIIEEALPEYRRGVEKLRSLVDP